MSSVRPLVVLAGALLAFGLVALSVVHVVAPQRDGPLALSQILAPYLFLLLVPFLVLVLTRGRAGRLLRIGLAVAAFAFVVRFVPGWVPFPGSAPATAAGSPRLGVLAWNLELGQPADATVTERLADSDAAIVGLVELTPHHAAAIQGDRALVDRHATVELRPKAGSLGIGLLSTLPPIGEPRLYHDPPILVQQLDAGQGRTVTVVVAHPLPGRIDTATGDVPIGYDSTPRDRHLAQVRGIVDPILRSGEPLVLLGDFNVVDREPGYADLAAGLVDAHRAVGLGPGDTWRPGRLEWLPMGLLRIDYVFTGNGVSPVSLAPDCRPTGSDHCLLEGVVALP